MKKIRLTERELTDIIKRVILEESSSNDMFTLLYSLRNSINDNNKKESMSIIDKLLSLANDEENVDMRPRKGPSKEYNKMSDFDFDF